ncbi:MAG: FKBP-type peptidyl-prolyl cis-trans isomerase [Panacagrimonas sp.]
MPKNFRLLAVCACAGLLFACAKKEEAAAPAELTTDAQKFGYSVGVDIGTSIQPVAAYVDVASLKQGLDDAAASNERIEKAKAALAADPASETLKTALTEAEKRPDVKLDDAAREAVKTTVSQKMQEEQTKQREEASTKATAEGEKFLAENGTKEGVKTTASGLQYKVLTEGAGTPPKSSDEVTVHYKGTLIGGEEFDSSIARGQPATFPLDRVIPGWTEGLQLMKPGAKYMFFIPAALGYGPQGAGAKIGPNQTLIFEVELISIGKPAAPEAAAPK